MKQTDKLHPPKEAEVKLSDMKLDEAEIERKIQSVVNEEMWNISYVEQRKESPKKDDLLSPEKQKPEQSKEDDIFDQPAVQRMIEKLSSIYT